MSIEFNAIRSKSYKEAINQYPNVWDEDMKIMKKYLNPKKGESIAEIGAGSGFFSYEISKLIGNKGKLFVVDPSLDQLMPLVKSDLTNLCFSCTTAENFQVPENHKLDKIWSRGAFHHVNNKVSVMSKLATSSNINAKLVIFDIFTGSSVAEFFDYFVSRACTTGHEVSFLSKEYASSLCHVSGWKEPELIDIPLKWQFNNKEEIGVFLSILLSNKPEYSYQNTLNAAEKILGIKENKNGVILNWPMTLMVTERL